MKGLLLLLAHCQPITVVKSKKYIHQTNHLHTVTRNGLPFDFWHVLGTLLSPFTTEVMIQQIFNHDDS